MDAEPDRGPLLRVEDPGNIPESASMIWPCVIRPLASADAGATTGPLATYNYII